MTLPRALPAVLILLLGLSSVAAQPSPLDPDRLIHGDGADAPGPPFHALSLYYGAGITAGGSVIDSSQGGLDLVELLINTRILYSPLITPGVRSTGPFYRIPGFDLWSNQISLNYEHDPLQEWAWGGSFSYFDINGRVDIPETFVYSPELPFDFNVQPPLAFRVTRRIQDRITLASALQVDGFLIWRASPTSDLSPYVRLILGFGRGWLGDVGKGPYIQEGHTGLALGVRYRATKTFFINLEGSYQYYIARTGPSNFFDRTETLINPGTGDVDIARLGLGAGVMW